jgi:hypothetical protein
MYVGRTTSEETASPVEVSLYSPAATFELRGCYRCCCSTVDVASCSAHTHTHKNRFTVPAVISLENNIRLISPLILAFIS